MGPLGWQETMFIFVLALLIFGPKKLPELGKTIGKAMTEFRRASSELKSTFDREMASIERETEPIKEAAQQYSAEISGYQYDSYYDSGYYGESQTSTASETSNVGASAPQGADSTNGTAEPAGETVARNAAPANPNAAAPEAVGGEKPPADNEPVKS